jgi:hypothetical protein
VVFGSVLAQAFCELLRLVVALSQRAEFSCHILVLTVLDLSSYDRCCERDRLWGGLRGGAVVATDGYPTGIRMLLGMSLVISVKG